MMAMFIPRAPSYLNSRLRDYATMGYIALNPKPKTLNQFPLFRPLGALEYYKY